MTCWVRFERALPFPSRRVQSFGFPEVRTDAVHRSPFSETDDCAGTSLNSASANWAAVSSF